MLTSMSTEMPNLQGRSKFLASVHIHEVHTVLKVYVNVRIQEGRTYEI